MNRHASYPDEKALLSQKSYRDHAKTAVFVDGDEKALSARGAEMEALFEP